MDIHCELMCASTFAFKYDRELVNTSEEHGFGSGSGNAGGSVYCRGILSACASCSESEFCSGKDYMTKRL
jgi:hypothetical protein